VVGESGEEEMGSEITRREVTEVSSTRINNDKPMREGAIQGRRYANIRDICTICGLSFVTERDKIRQSSFASGKFSEVTAPYEMWVDFDVIGHWLEMAPVEPGSRESDAAALIKEHCKPIQPKPLSYDLTDFSDVRRSLALANRAMEEVDRQAGEIASKDLIIACLSPKADSFDRIADLDGQFLVSDVAKKLGIKHAYLKLIITKELNWAYTLRGDTRLRATTRAKEMGFVDYHLHEQTPEGYVIPAQLRVTSKGLTKISDFISQSSNQSPKVRQIGG
jgi:phage antirepressor YoqD-like protein